MNWNAKVKDVIKDSETKCWDRANVEMVSKEDEIDCCYGLEVKGITKDDIEQLLNGKSIYTEINGGEYALLIALVEDDKKKNDREKNLFSEKMRLTERESDFLDTGITQC